MSNPSAKYIWIVIASPPCNKLLDDNYYLGTFDSLTSATLFVTQTYNALPFVEKEEEGESTGIELSDGEYLFEITSKAMIKKVFGQSCCKINPALIWIVRKELPFTDVDALNNRVNNHVI